MSKHNICTAVSSNGQVTFNDTTGEVILIRLDKDGELPDIRRFDVAEWKKYHSTEQLHKEIDILDLGYWYIEDGQEKYEEPEGDWRRGDARKETTTAYLKRVYGLELGDTTLGEDDTIEDVEAAMEKHDIQPLYEMDTEYLFTGKIPPHLRKEL